MWISSPDSMRLRCALDGFRALDVAAEMETVLGVSVDVIGDQPVSNPYLAQTINRDRVVIYESACSKAPV
jgi:hypothetical protein